MNKASIENKFLEYYEGRLDESAAAEMAKALREDDDLNTSFKDFVAAFELATSLREEMHEAPEGFALEVGNMVNNLDEVKRSSSMFGRMYSYFSRYILGVSLIIALLVGASIIISLSLSTSTAGYADPFYHNAIGNMFALIEGAAGALVMVVAFLIAVGTLFMPRRIKGKTWVPLAPTFLTVALLMFVTRSMVSLFFGVDFSDRDIFEESYNVAGETKSYVSPSSPQPSVRPVQQSFAPSFTSTGPVPATGSTAFERPGQSFNTEKYDRIYDNDFLEVTHNPLSTFSIDVDTASYSNVRRFLSPGNRMPRKDAVRIEEMVNYFKYDYPTSQDPQVPFSVITELSRAPWAPDHELLLVGLSGNDVAQEELPTSNLVFLIDVSGSMSSQNKLPLLKQSIRLLVDELGAEDRISIVVYAGAAGVVLPPTGGDRVNEVHSALDRLNAGGSTAGAAGIKLAYEVAQQGFVPGGNNRIILATDGDFNVGASSTSEIVRMIEEKRDQGVFLTVLGFGMNNYNDAMMEQLTNAGNGNYAYIDNIREAKKVLVHDLRGTLFTIAKDVKIQIEFNPIRVHSYRLIGYENRMLKKEDFNNDRKDAGELGAGHQVTAFYEIVRTGMVSPASSVDPLKYQKVAPRKDAASGGELATVKLRYKLPEESISNLLSEVVGSNAKPLDNATQTFRFASAVAEFGMLLRDSKYKGDASYSTVLERAKNARGEDLFGYRSEFLQLVETAETLDRLK